MKTTAILLAFAALVGYALLTIPRLTASKTGENPVEPRTPPSIRAFTLDRLESDTNVFSFEVIDRGSFVAALDPKPDIISCSFDNAKECKVSTLLPRDSWRINDLFVIDRSKFLAVGNSGTILKSVDGGKTWREMPRPTTYDLRRVVFMDASTGFVAGRFGVRKKASDPDEWHTTILKTEDGGETWHESIEIKNSRDVFALAICSPDVVIASIDGVRLIRSANGGKTWQDVNFGGTSAVDIAKDDNGGLWLVGSKGEIRESADLGLTWTRVSGLPQGLDQADWWAIAFDAEGHGVAVSENGVVIYTTDSGRKWNRTNSVINDKLRSLSLKEGFAIIGESQNLYRFTFDYGKK